jgi:hypothetical protein
MEEPHILIETIKLQNKYHNENITIYERETEELGMNKKKL